MEEAMIFRQLFEPVSGTYSYVLASRRGGEALIIDPVLDQVNRYLRLMEEVELNLVKAVDTHLHADHITGLGALRDRTQYITVMGAWLGAHEDGRPFSPRRSPSGLRHPGVARHERRRAGAIDRRVFLSSTAACAE
jgi:glyoxylase-like metal-dependent hydrolase (beta-lactamase superfamily II)